MSPEQLELRDKLVGKSREDVAKLKDEQCLTPATSDLFQAALTVLEMFARRGIPKGLEAQHRVLEVCVSRRPAAEVATLTPEELESWLVQDLGLTTLTGKIASNAASVDGTWMLEMHARDDFQRRAKEAFRLLIAHTVKLDMALVRHVATRAMDARVSKLISKSLSSEVKERPATAKDALEALGVEIGYKSRIESVSSAIGGEALPSAAKVNSADHADEDVSTTLGGIAQALVGYDDIPAALEACSHWLGVASTATARSQALGAYCNLWKRHGERLTNKLELSREPPHGHWKPEMLAGDDAVLQLVQATRKYCIEFVDLSRQNLKLSGPVLKSLSGLTTLLELKLRGCSLPGSEPCFSGLHRDAEANLRVRETFKRAGGLPPELGQLTNLRSLDVRQNALTGAAAV